MTTLERRFQIEVLPDLAWKEFLRRFRHAEELGFDEIGVYYPIDAQRDVFEHVATEVMPSLRDR